MNELALSSTTTGLRELALFAGAGGGLLGSILLGWHTVCAVEINDYCRKVLLQRQRDGMLDKFPIWDDVQTFDGRPWRGRVDVVTAGFPCQPWSVAGDQRGEADERNMWPDTIRIIREVGPRFCLLENVPGLLRSSYWGTILGELADSGYDTRWLCVSAEDVGAPHRRSRIWLVANLVGARLERNQCRIVENKQPIARYIARCVSGGPWDCVLGNGISESDILRKNNGFPHRVERTKALGNAQVPAMVRAAWNILMNTSEGT